MLKLHPKKGLTTVKINNYLRNTENFYGCYPIDEIPTFTSFPAFCIVNNQRSGKPGGHWLAILITKRNFFYFDSFGLSILETELEKYFRKYNRGRVFFSRKCIQHAQSISCGFFCIAFVKNVHSVISYDRFLDKFNSMNLIENDKIVKRFI